MHCMINAVHKTKCMALCVSISSVIIPNFAITMTIFVVVVILVGVPLFFYCVSCVGGFPHGSYTCASQLSHGS